MGEDNTSGIERMMDQYRRKVDFDETSKLTHTVDFYPSRCSLVGYMSEGNLAYQEQTGKYPRVDPETPDWNPPRLHQKDRGS